MAQSVKIAGNSWASVPYIDVPKSDNSGDARFIDTSDANAVASDITSGKTAYVNGVKLTGTNSGGGGSGVKIGTAEATPSSAGASISFTGLLGEPTSFIIISAADLATGAAPYKTNAVLYDGSAVKGQYITNASNAQMTYDGTAFSKSYSNGTLTVTGTASSFQAVKYKLIYTYGGSSANIGTNQVQVGSGATSISFSDLPDEPSCWYLLFTSDIGTSSGYTRALVVASDGADIYGMEMGSGAQATAHWTASYNNGVLTISSNSTSQGGYFHQPGYYELAYCIGGEIEITTEPLGVTENGTYTAPRGKAYTPVTVNVPTGGGSSKAIYTYEGLDERKANSYGATNAKVTVTKAGTYTISYVAIRGSSSGTMGTNLHIGSTSGSNNTTFNNGTYGQYVKLTGQSIAANTTVQIYATSGSNSRSLYVGQLIVEEE